MEVGGNQDVEDMTILENVTAGVTLATSTFTSAISIFGTEPLVYFVGAGFFLLGVAAVRKIMMPRKTSG